MVMHDSLESILLLLMNTSVLFFRSLRGPDCPQLGLFAQALVGPLTTALSVEKVMNTGQMLHLTFPGYRVFLPSRVPLDSSRE